MIKLSGQSLKNTLVALGLWSLIACGTYVGNPEEDDNVGVEEPSQDDPIENPAENPEYDDSKLIISIADAPVDDLSAVYIAVSEIAVKPAGDEDEAELQENWVTLQNENPEYINLLDYQDGSRLALAAE